jgi:Protein of unknown function (DUF3300)
MTMDPNLATPSRLYRPLSRSFPPNLRTLPARYRGLIGAGLLLALCCGRFVGQSSSTDQEWPQNHQDEPYSAEPEPDQGQPYANQQAYPDAAAPTRQPLDAGQLEQLVAPIALYPDALVAQVLAASTYPQQVADADRWRQAQGYATPDQIASAADAQGWDPSVKALTAFPQVLAQMDRNLQWTADLGNAYYNQPQDVLEAVQVMRRRAQAAGSLRSTPQEVVRYDQGDIVLTPPTPQMVYVPTYNPWTVYGAPVSPYPGFSLLGAIADVAGAFPLRFGLGIAMSSFTQPWGWLAWGLDWLGHALLFNHSDYYSHSRTVADWGFPHRGFYAYRGRGAFGSSGRDFARVRGGEEWRRGGFSSGAWHGFSRGAERPLDHWDGRANRGFESNRGIASNRGFESSRGFETGRGFQSYRDERSGVARPMERMPENRGAYRSDFNRGGSGFNRSEGYRASAGNSPRNEFREPRSFTRSSGNSRYGLFSGGRSHDNFASVGHSHANFGGGHSFFSGSSGHAPKHFGGSNGFGGGKGFGGGHSHGGGGGGHSHGGGGGKHHH